MSRKKHASNRRRRQRNIPRLICPLEFENLREYCLAPIESFSAFGERTETKRGPYYFQDNGANVLAVAHLDTVQDNKRFGCIKDDTGIVYNCQLDDRLGVWLALEYFPSVGIKMDILLTTGEESGASTALDFAPPREYNWVAEFDRAGTDVVTYGLESGDWVTAIGAQTEVGFGTYSDISELELLGVCAANWGVGYYCNHDANSHFIVSELADATHRFREFYRQWSGTSFASNPEAMGHYRPWLDFLDDMEDDLTSWYLSDEERTMREEWAEYCEEYGRSY